MAVEEINAAGGIKSLGGAKLVLLHADSQGKAQVGQAEAGMLGDLGSRIAGRLGTWAVGQLDGWGPGL